MYYYIDNKFKTKLKILPKKLSYVTDNPEIYSISRSLRLDCIQIRPDYFFNLDEIVEIIKQIEKDINTDNDILYSNVNTIRYYKYFNEIKNLYIFKKKYNNGINEIKINSINFFHLKFYKLNLSLLFDKFYFFLKIISKTLLLFFPSIIFFLRLHLSRKKNQLVISNKLFFNELDRNQKSKKNNIIISNNILNNKSLSLLPFYFIFFLIYLPCILFFYFKKKSNFKISFDRIVKVYLNFKISKYFRKFIFPEVVLTSNFDISESLLYFGSVNTNNLYNHGVHYLSNSYSYNILWNFHAKTMIINNNATIYSSRIEEKIFLKQFGLKIFFSNLYFKRFFTQNVFDFKKSKKIVIIETYKDTEFLRPFLYNDINQYIDFISDIYELSKLFNLNLSLRHRSNNILSTEFLKKLFPSVIFDTNANITETFNQNEVIISYSSTALYEAMLYKKNIISYDHINRNLNFLNLPIYNVNSKLKFPFSFSINNKHSLENIFKKLYGFNNN